jgi:hypothetical protein
VKKIEIQQYPLYDLEIIEENNFLDYEALYDNPWAREKLIQDALDRLDYSNIHILYNYRGEELIKSSPSYHPNSNYNVLKSPITHEEPPLILPLIYRFDIKDKISYNHQHLIGKLIDVLIENGFFENSVKSCQVIYMPTLHYILSKIGNISMRGVSNYTLN